MKLIFLILIFPVISLADSLAGKRVYPGMSSADFISLFRGKDINIDKTANIISVFDAAYGYPAYIMAGVDRDLVISISIIFERKDEKSPSALAIYADVKSSLIDKGSSACAIRIDGVRMEGDADLFSERSRNAFIFSSESNGVSYLLKLVSDDLATISRKGTVSLALHRSSDIQSPKTTK